MHVSDAFFVWLWTNPRENMHWFHPTSRQSTNITIHIMFISYVTHRYPGALHLLWVISNFRHYSVISLDPLKTHPSHDACKNTLTASCSHPCSWGSVKYPGRPPNKNWFINSWTRANKSWFSGPQGPHPDFRLHVALINLNAIINLCVTWSGCPIILS